MDTEQFPGSVPGHFAYTDDHHDSSRPNSLKSTEQQINCNLR
jgi:hypothetical protein